MFAMPFFYFRWGVRLFIQRFESFSCAENQRYAPNTRQRYHGINNTASKCGLSTEEPCDKIKLEQSDASPVQRADDRNNQGNSVHNHGQILL